MRLLIDSMNPQGTRAITYSLNKIKHNLEFIPDFKESIKKYKQSREKAFSLITVMGRWLIFYKANVLNDDHTLMNFIHFGVDLSTQKVDSVYSIADLQALSGLQIRYDKVYTDKMDTVALVFQEPYETALSENVFVCDDNNIVIAKAKELGISPMIENLFGKDKVKVTIADETKMVGDKEVISLYAIVHIIGNNDLSENGFFYLKIYDLKNNLNKIDKFISSINDFGVYFTRAFLMERLSKYKLN